MPIALDTGLIDICADPPPFVILSQQSQPNELLATFISNAAWVMKAKPWVFLKLFQITFKFSRPYSAHPMLFSVQL
jgi:hypothetical protein